MNIRFEQLVEIVKKLPKKRLNQLLAEIERDKVAEKSESNLEELLLNGPVATKRQLETIATNRNLINQWRTI